MQQAETISAGSAAQTSEKNSADFPGDGNSVSSGERPSKGPQMPADGVIRPEMVTLETMQQVVEISPFTKWSGTKVTACGNGHAALRMPFRKDLTQHHGFIHGGVIGFLSDNVSAWAAASAVGDVLTADYSVKFLAPGKGDYFTAEGNVIKASRRLVAVESKVYAHTKTENGEEKKLIAVGSATIMPAQPR